MQNVRSRSNGVAALKKCQPGFLRRGNKSQRQCLVSAHAAVESGSKLRRRNLVTDLKCFCRFAVRIAALQRQFVRFYKQRLVLELVLNPADRGLHRTVVEPVAHAQRKEVFAAVHGLRVEAQMFKGTTRQPFQLHRKQPVFIEGMILQRIRGHLRFAQIALFETVAVDDQNPVCLQVRNVYF